MSKKVITLLVMVAVITSVAGTAGAALITGVSRGGGSGNSAPQIAPDLLAEDVPCFVDRPHQYNEIPDFLVGAEYVMVANNDKTVGDYSLTVTVSQDVTIYLILDNRLGGTGGGKGTDPDLAAAGMNWVIDLGFVDTGEDIGIDESGDGDIDQYASIFSKQMSAGSITLGAQNDGGGRNMYGVAVFAPIVTATEPVPADGAMVGDTWVRLEWKAGVGAVSHDVYFGENAEDVNAGTGGTFQGTTDNTFFLVGVNFPGVPYPEGLVPGTTYYWRIDEFDGSETHKGEVWSFTVLPTTAFNPNPPDGSQYVDLNVTLQWQAGFGAVAHDVYFGDNFDDVNAGTGDTYKGLIGDTSFTPGTLEPETTYYWRVDEFTGAQTYRGEVWSFTTIPEIPPTGDPNLIGWWQLDEGEGTMALDWSGGGHHCAFADPAPTWVEGLVGGALEFSGGGDHISNPDGTFLDGLSAITICAWVKSDVTNTDKGFIIFENPMGNDDRNIRYDASGVAGGGYNCLKMGLTIATAAGNANQQLESSNNSQTTDWQHVALVWSSGQQLQLYLDGELDTPTFNDPAETGTLVGNVKVIIGKGCKDTGLASWDGLIDDVRIYNRVLTQEEIKSVMRGDPRLAWDPKPAHNRIVDIDQAQPLTWKQGEIAVQHHIYFGTDKNAVKYADTSTAGIYRGSQPVGNESYYPPEGLEFGSTYYWRIDEQNNDGSVSKGRLWKFTVAEYLIVDDFEDYNNSSPDRILWRSNGTWSVLSW